ncbi:hypothetical protein Tco_1289128 [Tanacetum coccineum]
MVADNIVEEAIVGDTVVGDNFAISIRNVVFENVVVPKANDIVVAETDDKIDIVVVDNDNVVVDIVGMSGVILEACVGAMECGSLEVQQVSLEGNMENQLSKIRSLSEGLSSGKLGSLYT